jgi:flagellar biogenesis protein FliO
MQSQFCYRFLHVNVSFALLLSSSLAAAQEAEPNVQATLVSMIVPLVLVVGAMILALVIVRRRFRLSSHDGPMQVRQILAVGPRERLVMIDIDEHTVIVGVSGSNVSQVALLPRVRAREELLSDRSAQR